jgi:elongation factor Tu
MTTTHLQILTIGAAKHGKTTLRQAITRVQRLAGRVRATSLGPVREVVYGVPLLVERTDWESDTRRYTQLDPEARGEIVKCLIARPVDVALLVLSAEGPIPSRVEAQIRLAKEAHVPRLVVYLNKVDLVDTHVVAQREDEIREIATRAGFIDVPVVRGSALVALEGGGAGSIVRLVAVLDSLPVRESGEPFLMPIDEAFQIPGRGPVVTGIVERGLIDVGDEVDLVGPGPIRRAKCSSIERRGAVATIALGGVRLDELARGAVLAQPATVRGHRRFRAEIYVLRREEGAPFGPPSEERVEVALHATAIEATVALPPGLDEIEQGDQVGVELALSKSHALESGQRFELRGPGGTFAAGVVTKILN